MIRYLSKSGDTASVSLFGVFAALSRDEVEDFPALRPHQEHAWHTFTSQIAAMAMLEAKLEEMPISEEGWFDLLLNLTPDYPDGEAWELVGDDWEKPALLQPPGLDPKKVKRSLNTPDGIDMLLTTRNHDLKSSRMLNAGLDDWLFALVSLQTQEGFMGAGNFGISRMNGGFGSRVGFRLAEAKSSPGQSFRRDVARLLEVRANVEKTSAAVGKLKLVWLRDWGEEKSIKFEDLDPYYVEICRRIRLFEEDDGIVAGLTPSKTARVESKALKGVTGDPWAPIKADGTSCWGMGEQGFGYRQVARILNPKHVSLPVLAMPAEIDGKGPLELQFSGICRGQGKTEGFHKRSIVVPPKAVKKFGQPAFRERLSYVAEKRLKIASDVAYNLRFALRSLAQGGPDEVRHDDALTEGKIKPFLTSYDLGVDRRFLDSSFWEEAVSKMAVDGKPVQSDLDWANIAADIARTVLDEAVSSMRSDGWKRHRAIVKSQGILESKLRFLLSDLDPTSFLEVKKDG